MSEGTVEEVLAGEARWHLHAGDFRALLATLPDACLDSCVCDPPYELGFMGRKWDASGIAYDVDGWRSVLRVLKPGGHLLAFGGTRTYHRMACAIEDAGFEIRDCIQWLYASGFPKSLNVSKAIDAHNGDERPVVGRAAAWTNERAKDKCVASMNTSPTEYDLTSAASAASAAWDGWGTALKPACEPIVVARKPLIGTVAANVLAHGTGGINVDGCRIPFATEDDQAAAAAAAQRLCREPQHGHGIGDMGIHGENQASSLAPYLASMDAGRWPANVIHDGSPEVLEAFARYGDRPSGVAVMRNGGGRRIWGSDNTTGPQPDEGYFDDGSAARFFKSCPFGKEDQWSASSAKSNSSQPSEPDGSAPSRAAIEEVREGRAFGASSPAPTTNATESGSRPDSGSATGTTRGTEQKSSSASPRANASTSESHASDADQRGQTDTTTTTPSRSMSDGSAASATLPITSGSTAHGVPVCRFMFCAKASRAERELGCEGLAAHTAGQATHRKDGSDGLKSPHAGAGRTAAGIRNVHPTVKPLALLRYLCRLVTPPGGVVLDPFAGSGTMGMAAILEGFRYLGAELDETHIPIARARIGHPLRVEEPEAPEGEAPRRQLGLF